VVFWVQDQGGFDENGLFDWLKGSQFGPSMAGSYGLLAQA
jgi:hypothetical protein